MRGNHHDAWVNGAADPISGMVLMEEASHSRTGQDGMKPKRTIVLRVGTGGTRPAGLYRVAEDHGKELQQNWWRISTLTATVGALYAQGSHTLQQMVSDVAGDVEDPQTGVSILERRKSAMAANASSAKAKRKSSISLP